MARSAPHRPKLRRVLRRGRTSRPGPGPGAGPGAALLSGRGKRRAYGPPRAPQEFRGGGHTAGRPTHPLAHLHRAGGRRHARRNTATGSTVGPATSKRRTWPGRRPSTSLRSMRDEQERSEERPRTSRRAARRPDQLWLSVLSHAGAVGPARTGARGGWRAALRPPDSQSQLPSVARLSGPMRPKRALPIVRPYC